MPKNQHLPYEKLNLLEFHARFPGERYCIKYLDEFCYRFNRRYHESELFDRLLLACVFAPPRTYTELTE